MLSQTDSWTLAAIALGCFSLFYLLNFIIETYLTRS
jgi:hypothetical protein